jgi:hypothetical protein
MRSIIHPQGERSDAHVHSPHSGLQKEIPGRQDERTSGKVAVSAIRSMPDAYIVFELTTLWNNDASLLNLPNCVGSTLEFR